MAYEKSTVISKPSILWGDAFLKYPAFMSVPSMVLTGARYNSAFLPTKEVTALVTSLNAIEERERIKMKVNMVWYIFFIQSSKKLYFMRFLMDYHRQHGN